MKFKTGLTQIAKIIPDIGDSILFDIANVARYFYTDKKDFWDIAKDFPNIAPPFPFFTMAYPYPTRLYSDDHGEVKLPAYVKNQQLYAIFRVIGEHRTEPIRCRWLVNLTLVTVDRKNIFPAIEWKAGITETGDLASLPDGEGHAFFLSAESPGAILYGIDYCHKAVSFTHPAFLALSFLHCKNVSIARKGPPKRRKPRKRDAGKVVYHVLKIEPMKKILATEGGATRTGIRQALHICRGHFRTYGTEGRGKLFGKLEGTFWIPSHVRGSRDVGVSDKDYDIFSAGLLSAVNRDAMPARSI